MRTLFITTIVLALTCCVWGQQNATVGRLLTIAEQDLNQSIDELNRLRETINREKVPLAEKLSALEDRLAKLRKEHADVTRGLDEANLRNVNLRTEIKARKDELAYVGNLLDEYARAYESRVHPCELQVVGPLVEAAKEAPNNPTLSMMDKFTVQTRLVSFSITRLFDAVGGMRFPGEGVDLESNVLKGQFAIIGPVALFRGDSDAQAGLVVPQTGSDKPLIRPLAGELQSGLATLVATGEGLLPLDPTRGAALKALVQKTSLIHIFHKGGPIMWPLLASSIIALAVVLERVLFIFLERLRRRPRQLSRFFELVGKGQLDEAAKLGEKSSFYVVRSLAYALRHTEESLASALLYAQNRELKRYRRGIAVLDTVITLAPLLGLLGTVTGMMGSFSLIGGELSAPGAITGGIAEALIATAFGLGIAIVALIPFNYLNNKTEQARHEMEAAGTQLELMMPASRRGPERSSESQDNGKSVPLPAPQLQVILPKIDLAGASGGHALVGKE